MLSADNLASIEADGRRMADLARRDPACSVPQYPGWTVMDLLTHVGSIHARTAIICRDLPTERPSAPRPGAADDLDEWCRANLDEMLAALADTDPESSVWGFWPRSTIGLWERRMVIETGVHRWDADQAFGEPRPLTDLVAVSGLDEFSDMWLPRLGEVPAVEVVAEDIGRSWVYGSGGPVESVTGMASDLYLRLMSRPSPVALPSAWSHAVDSLEPPPK